MQPSQASMGVEDEDAAAAHPYDTAALQRAGVVDVRGYLHRVALSGIAAMFRLQVSCFALLCFALVGVRCVQAWVFATRGSHTVRFPYCAPPNTHRLCPRTSFAGCLSRPACSVHCTTSFVACDASCLPLHATLSSRVAAEWTGLPPRTVPRHRWARMTLLALALACMLRPRLVKARPPAWHEWWLWAVFLSRPYLRTLRLPTTAQQRWMAPLPGAAAPVHQLLLHQQQAQRQQQQHRFRNCRLNAARLPWSAKRSQTWRWPQT